MAYQHGIQFTESPTSIIAPITGTSGLPVYIGTAPVNMVGKGAAINKPILAYKYEDAASQLGYSDDFEKYTLCGAMFAAFNFFNVAPVIFINVLDPKNSAHVKTVEAAEKKPEAHKIIIEEEGVIADTVTVKSGEDTLSNGDDFEITYSDTGKCIISLVETSTHYSDTTFTVGYSKLDPSAVKDSDIVGSYDADTGKETGLHLIRRIYPMFGVTPGLLCAPKFSAHATVAAKIQSLCAVMPEKFKCEAVLDIDTSEAKKYTDVKAAKEKAGINSSHTIALWPMACVGDKKIRLSTLVAAQMAYLDAEAGNVPVNPSNKPLGISALIDEDGNEIYLDIDQANDLNAQGIVTVINFNGFRTWGNNTAAYPGTTDPKDRWIYARRYFTWRGNSFMQTYFQKVDDPANYRLIESIVDSENIVGNSHVAQGLAARDQIEFRTEDNSINDILTGKIRFKMYLAPYSPAEVIESDLEFDPNAIATALSGGDEV